MAPTRKRSVWRRCTCWAVTIFLLGSYSVISLRAASAFHLEEATIEDIHRAIKAKQLTVTQLLNLYLKRIEAFNGPCVKGALDPATGLLLGQITPIENAGQINALMTLNIRGKRSRSDKADSDPSMRDALETARALDEQFAKTGSLVGPLHGIPFAIKDQFDTRDMRTTSGGAAKYTNDRPPRDAEVVARLRAAGAIILAKANMGEYAGGDRNTYGGNTCNPYDTTRSPGRSSGGSGAAVAANLAMCALAEETGPSTRNPAANGSLVGIVGTYSLVSRAGMMPATPSRDRVGVLCRTVKDAATVLGVIAGYDPKEPVTAASVGQMPREPYESFAVKPSLQGLRIGVLREFMQPFTKADEDSIRIANEAIADLKRLGATIVDPGPDGQLFKDALAQIVPSLYSPSRLTMPQDATLRWFMGSGDGGEGGGGEGQYALNRYFRERGDPTIRDIKSLIENSVFFDHPPIDGLSEPTLPRLERKIVRRETLKRQDNGAPFVREVPISGHDLTGSIAQQTILQMLVQKVMADHQLDALVYPTKTIPAPILDSPLVPTAIKSVPETTTVTIDGVKYVRTTERSLDSRSPMAWGLSPAAGLPTMAVPAGFTKEVYDPSVVVESDGRKKAGELMGPKAIALPVSIDFLGRPFSESVLIRIAAAYEQGTHHRRAPKNFGPIPGEP